MLERLKHIERLLQSTLDDAAKYPQLRLHPNHEFRIKQALLSLKG